MASVTMKHATFFEQKKESDYLFLCKNKQLNYNHKFKFFKAFFFFQVANISRWENYMTKSQIKQSQTWDGNWNV